MEEETVTGTIGREMWEITIHEDARTFRRGDTIEVEGIDPDRPVPLTIVSVSGGSSRNPCAEPVVTIVAERRPPERSDS